MKANSTKGFEILVNVMSIVKAITRVTIRPYSTKYKFLLF